VQREVTGTSRGILVDWLIHVADLNPMETGTLHLAVTLLDTVLSLVSVSKPTFQILGCVCLLIASKFRDIQVRDE
jgi:cyclin-A